MSFNVGPVYDSPEPLGVTPVVDGTLLSDLVDDFEKGRGVELAGGYGGLVPQNFRFGPLDRYFLHGLPHQRAVTGPPRIWLLDCQCGVMGCNSLEARVLFDDDSVAWSNFRQPNHDGRDYSAFGPFVFERKQYGLAVSELIQALSG